MSCGMKHKDGSIALWVCHKDAELFIFRHGIDGNSKRTDYGWIVVATWSNGIRAPVMWRECEILETKDD